MWTWILIFSIAYVTPLWGIGMLTPCTPELDGKCPCAQAPAEPGPARSPRSGARVAQSCEQHCAPSAKEQADDS